MPADLPVFLRGTEPDDPSRQVAERLRARVNNTGNVFFEAALLRQLAGVRIARCIEELPRGASTVVLSMANFISPTTDLGYVADALKAARVQQLVMVGAGAQAFGYGETVKLTKGTRRFLHLLADRSVSIGVRGDYTAHVLASYGIRNVEVIGCPSLFWSAKPAVRRRRPAGPLRLALHGTPVGEFRDKISALFALGIRHGADWILQSEGWLLPLLDGRPLAREDWHHLLYFAYPECPPEEAEAWLRAHLRVHFAADRWIAAMRRYDLAAGSRFHGNVAAVLAGVPALTMPFDTRTRELCDYHNLPVLPLHRFGPGLAPERLLELADMTLFRRSFAARLATYADFLEHNGLSHRFPAPAVTPAAVAVPPASAALLRLMTDLVGQGASAEQLMRAAGARLWAERDAPARMAADCGAFNEIDTVALIKAVA